MTVTRRSAQDLVPVPLSYIEKLLDKVDAENYGFSTQKNLTGAEQKLRNKALISLLYLSARRISELVGRTLVDPHTGEIVDTWEGVKVKDFRIRKVTRRTSLVFKVAILKKGRVETWRKKGKFPRKIVEVELSVKDKPFILHVLKWLSYLGQEKSAAKATFQSLVAEAKARYGRLKNIEDREFMDKLAEASERFNKAKLECDDIKVFDMDRTRAYQILTDLDGDVWLHWLRHMRLSHLAQFLDPYQLRKRLGHWSTLEPSLSYVHAREKPYYDALSKARKAFQ